MKTPHEMKTLSQCINSLQTQDDFKENFEVKGTQLLAPASGKLYPPEDITIVNFYRFEGTSDPADNSILYAIEAKDGVKGILLDSYGATSNAQIGEFIKRVEAIAKKEHLPKEI